MRNLRLLALLLVPLLALGLAAVANANDKDPDHGPTVEVPLAAEEGRAVGDDCTDPIIIDTLPYYGTGFTTCGALNNYTETCLGYYDGGEDTIFQLIITEQVTVNITMDPLGTTWSGVAIGAECPPGATCIAYSTGSSGSAKTIQNLTLAAGTYYIMVDTWPTPDCIPAFNLTIQPPPPPPVNDTCDGAIALERCSSGVVQGDLTAANADYNLVSTGSCTGYATAGKDVVYVMDLLAGDIVHLFYAGGYDEALYIITDCADPQNSCVIGEDGTVGQGETIDWVATADGTYYVICDAYAAGVGDDFTMDWSITCPLPTAVCCVGEVCYLYTEADCGLVGGAWHVDWTTCTPNPCEIPVPQDSESWGTIKSVYR
ncbi:MAG: hypothetical protein KBD56_09580 [Candidatus Eisenbacteria bacterium]|nr:hypothetical protein [Candidatus Eisenbacteria bacterium]